MTQPTSISRITPPKDGLNQPLKGFLKPQLIAITLNQADILLKHVHPITWPHTDLQGRTIQLWKYNNSLIASLEEDGNIYLLSGRYIYNALQPTENGEALLSRLERAGLKKWQFCYLPERRAVYVWPFLVAAGRNGPNKSETQQKIDSQKEHSKYSDLNAAWRESSRKEIVSRRADGTPHDHADEVRKAQNGYKKAIFQAKKELLYDKLTPTERARVTKELSEASRLLDHSEGFIRSPSRRDLSFNSFKEKVQINHLADSYNSCHPDHPIPEHRGAGGQIGGVGNEVGIMLGLFDGLSAQLETEHAFFMPVGGGKSSLNGEEIQQILRELAIGIFVHDTVPFFSLHFNGDANMYPIIHPAYEKTFVGHVISMLDYYMKGFLNGGFFNAAFVQEWNRTSNKDEKSLRDNIIDVRRYCAEHLGPDTHYHSIREIVQILEQIEANKSSQKKNNESPTLKDYTGFRSSFRIIAHQNSIQKTENLFTLDGDFNVLYTIAPDAAYEEELTKYRQLYGENPPSYNRLEKAYKAMCEQIKTTMPRLPEFKKLFEALNLINFFCYYFNTLKKANRFPLLPRGVSGLSAVSCPPLFPHLPTRAFYLQKGLTIKFSELFSTFSKAAKEAIVQTFILLKQPEEHMKQKAVDFLGKKIREYVCEKAENPLARKVRESLNYEEMALKILSQVKDVYNEVKEKELPALDKEIHSLEINYSSSKRSFDFEFVFQKAIAEAKMDDDFKKLSLLKEKRRALVNDPFSTLKSDAAFKVNLESADSILYLYSEQPDEEQRRTQKRTVGGCGVQLDRKPLKVDPNGYPILDRNYGPLSKLKEGEILQVADEEGLTSGVMFKLGFTDLPLLDEEEKQAALGYLSPPNPPLSEAMIDVFHAISTSDEDLFKKVADQIEDWNFQDSSGISLLHYAARSASPFILDYLIKRIRPDIRDSHGYTPLHYAAEQGNQAALLTLLSQAPGSVNHPGSGGHTPLYLAVQNNHLQVVRTLLLRGADPNCMTAQGMNALMCAIYRGFSNVALELLKQSTVNLDHALDDKTTALHLAVECNLPQVVEQLLAMGMDVNRKRWDGSTALHLAAVSGNLAIGHLLVNANGVALDLQLKSGRTALHLAAANDRYETVELLLQKGANPALFGWEGETALHTAVQYGSVKSALCLLHFVREKTLQVDGQQVLVKNLRNQRGQTALEMALKFQMNDLWPLLFDPLNDNPRDAGFEPLDLLLLLCHPGVDPNRICSFIEKNRLSGSFELQRVLGEVAKTGHNAAVSLLLSRYTIRNFPDAQGWTIHHYAAKFDHINLFSEVESLVKRGSSQFHDQDLKIWATIAAQHGSLRVLKLLLGLLDLRRDLNRSIVPIFCAAIHSRQHQAVDLIIHKIVNPNISLDENGRYATHIAVINSDREMLELLYKRGAKFDVQDKEGDTPLHYAVLYQREDTLEYLLDAKKGIPIPPDLLHVAAGKGSSKSLQLLLELLSIDAVHPLNQNTPLLAAIEDNNSENAVLLCARGANLHVRNSRGETPFLLAAQKNDAILKLLLRSDVASQTMSDGKNAIHLAVIRGFDEGVEILLQHGFDPSVRDSYQKTAADYASEKGYFDLTMMLEGKSTALRQLKQSIIQSLLKGDVRDFLSLIEGVPLNKPIIFTFPQENTLRLPLLHLIYDLVANKEKKLEILKAFSSIQGVDLEVKNSLGQTLLHLAAFADQDPPFDGMNVLAVDHSGMTPLHLFAQSESLERFKNLFAQLPAETRASFDVENEERETPLFYATEKNRLDIVLYLLEKGANPNQRCKKLQTPLGWAVENNSLPVIRALVERGARMEDSIGVKYEGPLHIALRKGFDEIARWLIANRAPVMQKDWQGREPIHIGAAQGNLRMVRFLHACGASLFVVDGNNDTVAHFAVQSKSAELIDFLREQGVSLEPFTIDGKSMSQVAPLHVVAKRGNLSMLAQFSRHKANFDVRDKSGNSALFYATLSGNPQVLELFSRSPLMEELDQVTRSIFVAIQQNDVQQLRILRNELKDINQRLDLHQGLTMLHVACMMGADRIVHDLINQGADLLLTTYDNMTPFGFAALHNHFEVAYQLSLHTTIDPNQKMPDGMTYLHLASERDSSTMIAFLIALGALVDATDLQGRTALHVATCKGNRKAIKLLLCLGATTGIKTLKGETAYEMTKDKELHELMTTYEKVLSSCLVNGEGKLQAAVRLGDIEAVLALSKIEDVYQRDKEGRTLLHHAVNQKNLSLLRRVIEVAPDLEVQDNQGKTPLFIAAIEAQDPALVQFLLTAGANPFTSLKDGTSLLAAIKQAGDSKPMSDIFKLLNLEAQL